MSGTDFGSEATWQTQRRSASLLTAGDGAAQRGKELHGTSWQKRTAGSSFFPLRDYWTCGAGEPDLPRTGWKKELRIHLQLWLPYAFKYTWKTSATKEMALDSHVRHVVRRPPPFLKIESYTHTHKKKGGGGSSPKIKVWHEITLKTKCCFGLWFQREWNLFKKPFPKIAETVMAQKKKKKKPRRRPTFLTSTRQGHF